MTNDLFSLICDIRDTNGLFAVMDPDRLWQELEKRGYQDCETASKIMEEMRSHFMITRTKPRLNELRNLAALVSQYEGMESNMVLQVLNDFNNCIFPDTVR